MAEDKPKLLIVEDDPGLQKQLKWCFDDYEVIAATDRATAMAALRRHEPGVVLQDLGLPPDAEGVTEGFACLLETLKAAPLTKVIVVTGQLDKQNAVRAVGMGAYDFYQKPVDTDVLRLLVQRAFNIHDLEERNRALLQRQGSMPLEGVIAISDSMMKACRTVEKVAPTNASVLLLGDSGTGKELLARAIHYNSPRRDKELVVLNCAAITETLLESELFGHEKGAFTGAVARKPGKFELADGGSIFLDEIGDMPLTTQAKVLRVLQEGELVRVGGTEAISVNVRCIAATHRDLRAMVEAGDFREDLFYRLHVYPVTLPPLRDRRDDIPLLAAHFLRRHSQTVGKPIEGIAEPALEALLRHSWPGNVRELENTLLRALILAEGDSISLADLPPLLSGTTPADNLAAYEAQAIREALRQTTGNLGSAAARLGLQTAELERRAELHGIVVRR
ncbi:MAG: PEP-CTERM-box response regulator transcription factor [Armatimonadetes bacterium]|nr:PEP-CTERM-box response regulator transcription factor [Armatimonadota bacterium]